ncbi:MAG: hypothetical protein AAGJ35_01695 [Myxococcota bacterium]
MRVHQSLRKLKSQVTSLGASSNKLKQKSSKVNDQLQKLITQSAKTDSTYLDFKEGLKSSSPPNAETIEDVLKGLASCEKAILATEEMLSNFTQALESFQEQAKQTKEQAQELSEDPIQGFVSDPETLDDAITQFQLFNEQLCSGLQAVRKLTELFNENKDDYEQGDLSARDLYEKLESTSHQDQLYKAVGQIGDTQIKARNTKALMEDSTPLMTSTEKEVEGAINLGNSIEQKSQEKKKFTGDDVYQFFVEASQKDGGLNGYKDTVLLKDLGQILREQESSST